MIRNYDLSKYTSILDVRITKIFFQYNLIHIQTKLNRNNRVRLSIEVFENGIEVFGILYDLIRLRPTQFEKAVKEGIIQ